MAGVAFASGLDPDLGPFLFAAIGEDPNGKMLTVLSAFARTNIDPWQEAANLSRMSREVATARMVEFICALPDNPNALIPAKTVASDLIALLPQTKTSLRGMAGKSSEVSTTADPRLGLGFMAIAVVIAILFLSLSSPAPQSGPEAAPPLSNGASTTRLSPSELGQ